MCYNRWDFWGEIMKSLVDYDFLVNEVFYRCQHILDYIESHPNMSDLEREAVKATIMDALVYKGLIDPNKESLDFDNLCIRDDLNHYVYDKHPNICGIPQWMKEEFRKKSIVVSAGIPISLFLTKPPSKYMRYCVYDPNTCVGSVFPDATHYNVFYTSPTRGVRIDDVRPFVEVEIDGELYLVDTLTKRIIKSSFFRKNYGFDVVSSYKVSELTGEFKKHYEEQTAERDNLSTMIPFYEMTIDALASIPDNAEMIYEFNKCREYYPIAFEECEREKTFMKEIFI